MGRTDTVSDMVYTEEMTNEKIKLLLSRESRQSGMRVEKKREEVREDSCINSMQVLDIERVVRKSQVWVKRSWICRQPSIVSHKSDLSSNEK